MAGNCVLTGSIAFDKPLEPEAGTIARVLVEDVTLADAASVAVAQVNLPLSAMAAASGSLPFTLTVPEVDASRRYAVRVHIDRSGNGRIEAGDQISTQSYPVLTQGSPQAELRVAVVPVRG